MSMDDVRPMASTMQGTQYIGSSEPIAGTGTQIISLFQSLSSILIIIGLIVGIIYMIKSKKDTGKKILIGCIIIAVPIIVYIILTIVKTNMLLSVL